MISDMKPTKDKAPKGDHQNIARVHLVMNAIADSSGAGLRLVDVVEKTGLASGPVHRLLNGLASYGFVDFEEASGRYYLGLQITSWAFSAANRYGLAPFVEPSLERLAERTQDTVYFSLLSRDRSICVDRHEGDHPVRTLTTEIGQTYPLGLGSASLAIFAFQPDDYIEKILDEQEEQRAFAKVSREQLVKDIAETRERGVSIVEALLIEGMTGIGIPILRNDGRAIGAINITATTSRLSGERRDQVIAWMKEEVDAIRERAGSTLDAAFVRRRRGARRTI